jgi:hypothetical protein
MSDKLQQLQKIMADYDFNNGDIYEVDHNLDFDSLRNDVERCGLIVELDDAGDVTVVDGGYMRTSIDPETGSIDVVM